MYVLQNIFDRKYTLVWNMNFSSQETIRVDVNIIGYEYFIVQLVNQKHQQKVLI